MSSINCKTELKLRQIKYYVLTAAGSDNTDATTNIFIIKDTQLYDPVVALSGKDNQKL